MNFERSIAVSVCGGVAAAALLVLGYGNAGGLVALVQQCLLVGLPLSVALGRGLLRTWRVVLAMAFGTSLALSAVTAQLLIWFEVADGPALVLSATVYGVILGSLVHSGLGARAQRSERSAPRFRR